MFGLDTALFTFFGTSLLGGIIWGIRQEGRITTLQEQRFTDRQALHERHQDLKELMTTRFNATDQRLDSIERALNRG
jgi:hypothetical protein